MSKRNKAAIIALPTKVVGKPAEVTIHKLPTGVRGLDDILGGGIPEYSFNIIACEIQYPRPRGHDKAALFQDRYELRR